MYEYASFNIFGSFDMRIAAYAELGWEPVCKIGGLWPGYSVMLFRRELDEEPWDISEDPDDGYQGNPAGPWDTYSA